MCNAINIAINSVRTIFESFRTTIQYGVDVLGSRFKTFGEVVKAVLKFDFSGAKIAYENGLRDLSDLTDRYSKKMGIHGEALSITWQEGVGNIGATWATTGAKISNVANAGNEKLQNLFLKNPLDQKQQDQVKTGNTTKTFDSNRGIGSGVDPKSKDKADSKYDATSYSDLRIKSPEAYAGGKSHQGVLDLAAAIQEKFQITRFTAFNDTYHKGTNSKHAQGLALDFGLQDQSKSGQVASNLRTMLEKNGVKGQVLDEYKNPSKRATGGHIHVSFNSQADADKYLSLTKTDKLKEGKKSSSDSQYEQYLENEQRKADEAKKQKLALQYKYADERKKIAIELENELKEIEKSSLNPVDKAAFKVKAEKDASDKLVQLESEEFEKIKVLKEQRIENDLFIAQRAYEIDKAGVQAAFDARKISNVEKVRLEKELEDKLREVKRIGLQERFDLEGQMSGKSGKPGNQNQISDSIADLDTDKKVSDTGFAGVMSEAEMSDFDAKFGGFTSRISGLWDNAMQSMMNGTLTWRNATNAIYTEMAGAFIQSMISEPLKKYAASLATRMAIKLGFIKTETAAEVAGQAAQTGAVVVGEGLKTTATAAGVFARIGMKVMETLKSIMLSAWEAMAGAWAALSAIPIVGPALGVAAGIAAFAGVSAIVGKVASARGGYDIPAGVNPMTQLHEEEMVLPKQHANTIRALGKSVMGDGSMSSSQATEGSGEINNFNFQSWDSKDLRRFMKKHGRELAGGLKSHRRSFGK